MISNKNEKTIKGGNVNFMKTKKVRSRVNLFPTLSEKQDGDICPLIVISDNDTLFHEHSPSSKVQFVFYRFFPSLFFISILY